MTFKDHIAHLPSEELIKLAEDMRENLMTTFSHFARPVFEKLASEQAGGNVQGNSNEGDALGKENNGINREALKEALQEAIVTNDIGALGQIIQTLQQQYGEDVAANAINLARTVMQEALAQNQLAPEHVATFAKAFEAFDAGAGNFEAKK